MWFELQVCLGPEDETDEETETETEDETEDNTVQAEPKSPAQVIGDCDGAGTLN